MTPMLSGKDGDDVSDMDEPMASQSNDAEAPLTHNTSKSNFFNMETGGAAAASDKKKEGSPDEKKKRSE